MITNLFGTDGIRKAVGLSPFTVHELPLLGFAIGTWLTNKYGTHTHMVLAHDTRESSHFIKSALKTGLLAHGISIHDAHILPTPAVARLVQMHATLHCGIIISASHNPYHDNGLKIFDAEGNKLHADDIEQINQLFATIANIPSAYNNFGTEYHTHQYADIYSNAVCALFPAHFLSGITILLDCAFGATYHVAPRIFKQLGAHVTAICTEYTGRNINDHCGSEYPDRLQEAVCLQKADIGFAFDGDGDRVIAVTSAGVFKDGDSILALLLKHPAYKDQPSIVGTDMTNQGLAVHLHRHNKTLARTPVGDIHVMNRLIVDNLLLGGEQSGHIIMRDISNNADGIITALRLLESLLYTNNWQLESFEAFPQTLINVPIAFKKDLATSSLKAIIEYYKTQLDNSSRLLVRYSGTEPIIRIMVEDASETHARYIGTELSRALQKELT